jgi:hypothetical protein
MIPDLDFFGTLPPGTHRATFDEVIERFGGKSLKRDQITFRLKELYACAKEFTLGLYIDGSYVTGKVAPSDVDLLLLLPPIFDFFSAKAIQLADIIDRSQGQLHVFAYDRQKPDQDALFSEIFWNFTHVHGTGREKGIIYVEGRQ